MRRPAKKYLSIYLTSIVLLVTTTPTVAESWVVESQDDWTAARGAADNVTKPVSRVSSKPFPKSAS